MVTHSLWVSIYTLVTFTPYLQACSICYSPTGSSELPWWGQIGQESWSPRWSGNPGAFRALSGLAFWSMELSQTDFLEESHRWSPVFSSILSLPFLAFPVPRMLTPGMLSGACSLKVVESVFFSLTLAGSAVWAQQCWETLPCLLTQGRRRLSWETVSLF